MRFRTKTVLGVALIELALLAILVGSSLDVLRDTNEKELVRRVQSGGRMIAAAAKDAVISQDLATLDSLAKEVIASGQADYVRILDSAGTVLAEYGPPSLLARPFRKDDGIGQVDDGVFDWSSPIAAGGAAYGLVTLGVSTEPLSTLLASARRWAASIASLEMLLVALFSWLLGSYLLHQLVALRDASSRLSAGEFGYRVPVSGRDELAQTAQAFNRMAERIDEINAGLERQVAARTEELNAANEHLRIAAATFETHDPIVITDAHANILRVNRAFTEITGYGEGEVLGKNPSIMNSGRHDKAFFAEMWRQLVEKGSWAGEVWDRRKSGQVYPKWLTITAVRNEAGETTHYVAIFSDITARKEAEEEIFDLAFYDPLTRLPNRRLFLDRFRTALAVSERNDAYGGILFIDMDNFKALNDTFGHDHGDLMLTEVAARIRSCIRETDTAARLGGDEFVVLVGNLGGKESVAASRVGAVAEKIRDMLARPYPIKGHEHRSSPSIGICLFRGSGMPVETLLQHADMAMYQAKESGRNTVRFFDPEAQRKA